MASKRRYEPGFLVAIQQAKPSGIDCTRQCLSEWYPRMSRLWKSQHFGDNSTIPDNNLMPNSIKSTGSSGHQGRKYRMNYGRAEGVAADLGLDPGRERPPANHPPHVGLEQGIASHLPRSAGRRPEDRAFPVLGDAGSRDVLLQIAIEIMVGRHLVLLAPSRGAAPRQEIKPVPPC